MIVLWHYHSTVELWWNCGTMIVLWYYASTVVLLQYFGTTLVLSYYGRTAMCHMYVTTPLVGGGLLGINEWMDEGINEWMNARCRNTTSAKQPSPLSPQASTRLSSPPVPHWPAGGANRKDCARHSQTNRMFPVSASRSDAELNPQVLLLISSHPLIHREDLFTCR